MLSSWIELRYSATQVLPGSNGIADELEGITQWRIEAVQCFENGVSKQVGQTHAAVFRPGPGLTRGPAAQVTAAALGGGIERAVAVLLADDGSLREDLGGEEVEHVMVMLNDVPEPAAARAGVALRAVDAIADRLAPGRTLVASVPDVFTDDEAAPAFLQGLPPEVTAGWRNRGLRHAGRGVWVLSTR